MKCYLSYILGHATATAGNYTCSWQRHEACEELEEARICPEDFRDPGARFQLSLSLSTAFLQAFTRTAQGLSGAAGGRDCLALIGHVHQIRGSHSVRKF
jgi:hypothetical protein